MKYLIGLVIGIGMLWAGTALADGGRIYDREISVSTTYGDIIIFKFVDPDNGNVCYMTQPFGYKGLGISCLKP